jgi:hypothetical protein
LTLLLTFGIVFPILAVIICVGLLSQFIFYRLLIGRVVTELEKKLMAEQQKRILTAPPPANNSNVSELQSSSSLQLANRRTQHRSSRASGVHLPTITEFYVPTKWQC